MGTAHRQFTLHGPSGQRVIEALVHTGATFTWALRPMLEARGSISCLALASMLSDERKVNQVLC